MERFTEKLLDGRCILKDYTKVHSSKYGDFIEGDAVDKLAEYEDLEEQGLLLRLPCKIGDTVYVIPSKSNYELNLLHKHFECNRVYAQKVHSIEIYNSGRYGYTLTTCEGWNRVISDHYGETWFLTQAEAEAALKQMGE